MTRIDAEDARALALSLRRVYSAVAEKIEEENATSPLIEKVTGHLGCPLGDVVVVEEKYRLYEHAGLQTAADLYLNEHSPDARWFGIVGGERGWQSMLNMLLGAMRDGSVLLGRAGYSSAPIGPDQMLEVVQLGMVATAAPDGSPVVVGLSSRDDFEPNCLLTVYAAERSAAVAVREEIDRLKREHDPFRGQVLSFGVSEHGSNEIVSFLPRPELRPAEVVLSDGRLEAIEDHIVGIAEEADRLRESGQHLRRGLLLYGPPGTGKTMLARAVATEAGVPFLHASGSDFVEKYVGVGARRVRDLFAQAKRLGKAVIFIDEFDALGKARGGQNSHEEREQTLNQLLVELDGFGTSGEIVVIAATARWAAGRQRDNSSLLSR